MPRVLSGHVLSETAGARNPLYVGSRLIPSRRPAGPKGASIDGEDRFFAEPPFRRLGGCGSNHLSGGGLFARLRGQAQVVAARPSRGAARHVQ